MLIRRIVVAAVFLLAASAAQAQFDGTWKGTLTADITCSGAPAKQSADLVVVISQAGTSVSGNVTITQANDACAPGSPTSSFTLPVTGTVSGSTLSGQIPGASFTANVTGNTMTISVGSGHPLTGTLTKDVPPSVDVTGTWSGAMNVTEPCGNGTQSTSWSSPMSASFVQQGATVTGTFTAFSVPDRDDRCNVVRLFAVVIPFQGQVSGNTLSGSTFGLEEGPLTGIVSGSTMSISGTSSNDGSTITATLTRGSSGIPDTHLSGSYSGSHSGHFIPCAGGKHALPRLATSGTLNGSMTQVGATIYGEFSATGFKQDHDNGSQCIVTDDTDGSVAFFGQLNGNTITGLVFSGGEDDDLPPFTATVTGNTITGSVPGQYPGEDTTFTLTRTGQTATPPQIVSFTANPPSIRAGQPTTLSWSTNAATSVTIDNNVGSQAATGTIVVSPSTTTTYVLTATQGSQSTTASVTVQVFTAPIVNVTALPASMLQVAGSAGGNASYTLTNSGSAATSITLTQNGSFFTQSPTSFTLQPGASQTVTITATAQSAGSYEGASIPSGTGVPSGLQIAVKLLSAAPPTGTVTADPVSTRVDVAAAGSAGPSGSVSFKNNGSARLVGILNSDQPWLIPQTGSVTIDPGQTGTFTFTIDRSKRPDASALIGSTEATLTISFLSGGASFAKETQQATGTTPSVSIVKVVDTVQPPVTTAGIPGLATNEIALFIPGVGHVIGTAGRLFVSDVSILNPQGSKAINDVKMYYTSTTGSSSSARTTTLPSVPGQAAVAVGDVVKSVFSGTDERGTLQLRSNDADKIALSATAITTNNPAGTFGNTIPVFRSDRAIAANETLVLNGLRKDGTTHTNIYVQEAAGFGAIAQIDFLAADGSTVSSRAADNIDAFKLLALDNVVPANAVAAVITNKSTAGGKIVAYATPLDEGSGDTWAIADWSRALGYTTSEPVVIPVAGSVHGANNTFYRTDVSITNRATDPATATLRYTSRTGTTASQVISIAARSTKVMNDVIASFNIAGDTVGYLTLTPLSGAFAVSSRTFTTAGSSPNTFGSGVPAVAASSAMHIGNTRPIAGLADAARSTVIAGKAATYRTNFGLMETAGSPVTVRVTFRFTFPAGEKAQGIGSASRDYTLNASGFLLLNSIAGEILGTARLQYGDLSNVEADFSVIDGGGAVMLFTSSVDNGTGDSILRTE